MLLSRRALLQFSAAATALSAARLGITDPAESEGADVDGADTDPPAAPDTAGTAGAAAHDAEAVATEGAGSTVLSGFNATAIEIPYSSFSRHVLILVPRHLDPALRHPGVVLLHGYTRRFHGDRRIYAWRDGYGLTQSYERLQQLPLRRALPYRPYLTKDRIKEVELQLTKRPFAGMVLICPSVPVPYFVDDPSAIYERYSEWLAEELLSTVRSVAPLTYQPAGVGLAGVSMGGRTALEAVVRHPEAWGALSLMQPELTPRNAQPQAVRLAQAFGHKPLRIVTSTRDPYRSAIEIFASALEQLGTKPSLAYSPGPHDADWMREVGSLETLLFHDRRLTVDRSAYIVRRLDDLSLER